MKKLLFICFCYSLISCKNENKNIVPSKYIDSLFAHYDASSAIKANQDELDFWGKRMNPSMPDVVNDVKYSGSLIGRFHLLGDINDIKKADSILKNLSAVYNNKEAGIFLALSGYSILQHQFKAADEYLNTAKLIGLKKYELFAASFDVDFELCRMYLAEKSLNNIHFENDYGYQFRHSKLLHYNGELDSSIIAMQKSIELAGQNLSLKQVSLSNVGDLYIHAGQLDKSYHYFTQSIQISAADLHSIMGIGWISLVHDKNDSLAEKIFQFVNTKTKSPDPLYKLIQVAEQRGDRTLQKKYARAFEEKVTDILYGNMYNKYLIQLYTGILNEPLKAEAIAKKELENRSTPQTNAWYVWTLLCNKKTDEANAIYQKSVSGKPLEALELYWMGKLMLALNKGYNAKEFFKEAEKNKYDLSPAIAKDLQQLL